MITKEYLKHSLEISHINCCGKSHILDSHPGQRVSKRREKTWGQKDVGSGLTIDIVVRKDVGSGLTIDIVVRVKTWGQALQLTSLFGALYCAADRRITNAERRANCFELIVLAQTGHCHGLFGITVFPLEVT
jgi:hypothetical protein